MKKLNWPQPFLTKYNKKTWNNKTDLLQNRLLHLGRFLCLLHVPRTLSMG